MRGCCLDYMICLGRNCALWLSETKRDGDNYGLATLERGSLPNRECDHEHGLISRDGLKTMSQGSLTLALWPEPDDAEGL